MLNKNCNKNHNKKAAQKDAYDSSVGVCPEGYRNPFSEHIFHSVEGAVVRQWVNTKQMAQQGVQVCGIHDFFGGILSESRPNCQKNWMHFW